MAFESKSVTVTAVDRTRPDRVIITLNDGSGIEFPGTWAEFVTAIESRLGGFDASFVACFALARWIARNPTGANPSQIVGRTATLNLGATNISNVLQIS